MDTNLFDRIVSAVEEIPGKTLTRNEIPESPLGGQIPDADLFIDFQGCRFAVFCDGPGDVPHECSILLPLPEYAVPVDTARLLRLVEACRRSRLAIGHDASSASREPYLIGIDYVMPSESITGTTLQWVLGSLMHDMSEVESALDET
jgi:hypothetical protein